MARFNSVQDIRDWRLCLGCGACAYICPEKKIQLVDFLEEGIRPALQNNDCSGCSLCVEVCPAAENDHGSINARPGLIEELKVACGPVLEIWEGHARDPEIRFAGSSGGAITALAQYCLDREGMAGVLHIGQDQNDPYANATYLSRTKTELLSRTGSRYAPASTCDRLDLIESASAPCVFVGQPSEVTALRKAQELRPELDRHVGVAISFFCAGSPSREGTLELVKKLGISPESVSTLRYRGKGWPGNFSIARNGEEDRPIRELSYKESWGFVQAFRPFSTHLSPDGSGEDADISCGDPWYRPVAPGEPGSSLVLARTERGRQIVQRAIAAGYLELTRAEPWKVIESQKGLIAKRGAIGGRVAVLRLMGLPAPKLKGFYLFRNWMRLTFEEKLRSTVGNLRRVLSRGYYRKWKPNPQSKSLTRTYETRAAAAPAQVSNV